MGSSVGQNFYAAHAKKAKKADYTFRINGQVVENSMVKDSNGEYRVNIPEIYVNSLNLQNTLTITYHEGKADEQIFSYTVSPNAYMYIASTQSENPDVRKVAFYLYNYFVTTTTKDIL